MAERIEGTRSGFVVRPLVEDDAAAFLRLREVTDSETPFLMRSLGEDAVDENTMRGRIRSLLTTGTNVILVCTKNGTLIGYLDARGGAFLRNRGVIHFSMAIRRKHWRKGVGYSMVTALEVWARSIGAYRLEFVVSIDNITSIRLFEKMGFVSEGVKRRAARVEGAFVDKLCMAKLL